MQIARRIALSSSKHLTHSKQVFNRIPDVERGSNAYWHRRQFATSVAVDISKVRKSPKKVSRDERKAMVESFINKYKAMNGGEYPSVSVTRKQVGGCYYVTKNIFQEILRNSAGTKSENVQERKLDGVNEASTNIEDVSESRAVIDKGICQDDQGGRLNDVDTIDSSLKVVEHHGKESPTNIEDVSESCVVIDKGICRDDQSGRLNDVDTNDSSLKVVEHHGKESPSYSDILSSEVVVCKTKDDCAIPVGSQKDILERKPEVASNKCLEEVEHDVEIKSPSEGVLDLDRSKPKCDHYEKSTESENAASSVKQQNDDDQEPPKQSSVWGNIKSLAGGIINLWKKF